MVIKSCFLVVSFSYVIAQCMDGECNYLIALFLRATIWNKICLRGTLLVLKLCFLKASWPGVNMSERKYRLRNTKNGVKSLYLSANSKGICTITVVDNSIKLQL